MALARRGSGQRRNDSKLQDYRSRQATVRDNPQDHVELADWCRSQRLVEQEHAHLLRGLDFDPDNARLRKRVGHVKGDRAWQSPSEASQQKELQKQLAAAKEQWLPALKDLRRH